MKTHFISLKLRSQILFFLTSGLMLSAGQGETIYTESADLSLKFAREAGVAPQSNGPNEAGLNVGKSGSGQGFDRAAVVVFQLPDLGMTDDPFGTASLGVYLVQNTMIGDVNADLYGLGRRDFPDVFLDDYFGRDQGPDDSDATLIQDNFLTQNGLTLNSLVSTSIEGSMALTDYLNTQYEGGVGIGQYVFLRINTDADTARRWNLLSSEGAMGDLAKTPQLSYLAASAPVDTIQVESEANGSGQAIPDQTLVAGESLTAFAISREAGGGVLGNVPVTWTVSNITGEITAGDLIVSENSTSATFTAAGPGTAEITIFGNASELIGTGTITVVIGPPAQVLVEDADGGFGEPIEDRFLISPESLTAYAISRDVAGNFVASESAVWSLEEVTGDVVEDDLVASADGTNATLVGNEFGAARIRVAVDGLDSVDSGLITVTELMARWDGGGANVNWGTAANWFGDIAPNFDHTTDIILHDPAITRLNPYLGSDRTIRSLTYSADADKNFNVGTTANGTTIPMNLTFDTDSMTAPAEIVVDADATGNFRLGNVKQTTIEEYGSVLLADDLLVTHNGGGTLTIDAKIGELDAPRSLTKAGTGTLILTGANSYTGDTSVSGGMLSVNGTSLSDIGTLSINGGLLEVSGNEVVGNLFLNGQRRLAGVYGSSFSDAPVANQDDSIFAGAGVITVSGVALSGLEITDIEIVDGLVTLTWVSNPGDQYTVSYSNDLLDFSFELTDDVLAEAAGDRTSYSFSTNLLGDLDQAFFVVKRN